jgi:uroporphyrinogen decarboxylase
MTPRERWTAMINGGEMDRPPCDYWGTAEVTERLKLDLACTSDRQLWEKLGIDKLIHLAPRHPRATEQNWHLQSLFSIWHIGTAQIPYADGLGIYEETVVHPLAEAQSVADVERFDWPDPAEWDLSGLRTECEAWRDYPILSGTSEIFYLYCRLRGMEQALTDLVENPALAECAIEHIASIDLALMRRIFEEAGDHILFTYVAEDLGTQESLIMSPRTFRHFLKPRMARIIDQAHSFGVKVFHHDDGSIRAVLPDLLDIGIDLLNPIQWRCRGMEREALARDFGGRVIFHGGVDNQKTLPFGTPQDVRLEVQENLHLFSGGRGYVVAPCHNIQANTPTANVVAMYEAVHETPETR